MKRLLTGLAVIGAAGLFSVLAQAADFLVQTVAITDGGTAVSTVLTTNTQYAIQCNGNTRYRVCATSACTATGFDWMVPQAGMDLPLTTDNSSPPAAGQFVGINADGGNVSCGIYKAVPATLPAFPGQ